MIFVLEPPHSFPMLPLCVSAAAAAVCALRRRVDGHKPPQQSDSAVPCAQRWARRRPRRTPPDAAAAVDAADAADAAAADAAHGVAFRFGLIADVQYVDADDAWDFHKKNLRRYRGSLKSVRQAAEVWSAPAAPVLFVGQLGDVIDGRCAAECGSAVALQHVKDAMSALNPAVPIHDCVGNHEGYNFTREDMVAAGLFRPWRRHRPTYGGTGDCAASRSSMRLYYAFRPAPGWCFVVLDAVRTVACVWSFGCAPACVERCWLTPTPGFPVCPPLCAAPFASTT